MKIRRLLSASSIFVLSLSGLMTVMPQAIHANEIQFLCRLPGTVLNGNTLESPTLTISATDLSERALVVWETEYFSNWEHPVQREFNYYPLIRCQEAVLTFKNYLECGLLENGVVLASIRERNGMVYPVLETIKQPDLHQCPSLEAERGMGSRLLLLLPPVEGQETSHTAASERAEAALRQFNDIRAYSAVEPIRN